MTKIQTYTGSIYLIINKLNNKKYVGQTIQGVEKRFSQHSSKSDCPKLYNAIKKYGKDAFKVVTLKMFACSDFETLHKQLDYWETWYIKYYNSVDKGYNCTFGGQKAKEYTQEYKDQISKTLKEYFTPEVRKQLSVQRRQYFKDHPETRQKLSNAFKGKFNGPTSKPVDQFDMDGNFIRHWPSISEAKRFFGIENSHISGVCKGKLNSTLGYKWKYSK